MREVQPDESVLRFRHEDSPTSVVQRVSTSLIDERQIQEPVFEVQVYS